MLVAIRRLKVQTGSIDEEVRRVENGLVSIPCASAGILPLELVDDIHDVGMAAQRKGSHRCRTLLQLNRESEHGYGGSLTTRPSDANSRSAWMCGAYSSHTLYRHAWHRIRFRGCDAQPSQRR
jgi:hypothetical protein